MIRDVDELEALVAQLQDEILDLSRLLGEKDWIIEELRRELQCWRQQCTCLSSPD